MTRDSPAGFLVLILKGVLGVDPERIADGSRGLSEATPPENVESWYLILKGSQQLLHAAIAAIPSGSNRIRSDRTGGVPCRQTAG